MELELILRELRPFEVSYVRQFFLHSKVWGLCNQLLLQLSVNLYETLHACCGHNENVHVVF